MNLRSILRDLLTGAALLTAPLLWAAPPQVSMSADAITWDDKNGTATVTYRVTDTDTPFVFVRAEVSEDGGKTWNVPASTFTGDIGKQIPADGSRRTFVWDASADWGTEYSDQMRIRIIADDADALPGTEDAPEDAWSDPIEAGSFLMGQQQAPEGIGPNCTVNIPYPYQLAKKETTCSQYAEFLNTVLAAGLAEFIPQSDLIQATYGAGEYGVSNDPLCRYGSSTPFTRIGGKVAVVPGNEQLPVQVFWQGALFFCRFYGLDLPTEGEWEKAARGPTAQTNHRRYPWGQEVDEAFMNPLREPEAVAQRRPTGYGLYDIIGNAAEWTRSRALPLTQQDSFSKQVIRAYPAFENEHWLTDPNAKTESPSQLTHSDAYVNINPNTALVGFRIARGSGTQPIYVRDGLQTSFSIGNLGGTAGFRPVRRELSDSDRLPKRDEIQHTGLYESFKSWDPSDRSTWKTLGEPWGKMYSGTQVLKSGTYAALKINRLIGFPANLKLDTLRPGRALFHVRANNSGPESVILKLGDASGNFTCATLPPNMLDFADVTLGIPPEGVALLSTGRSSSVMINGLKIETQEVLNLSQLTETMTPTLHERFENAKTIIKNTDIRTALGHWLFSLCSVSAKTDTSVGSYLEVNGRFTIKTPDLGAPPDGLQLRVRNDSGSERSLTVSWEGSTECSIITIPSNKNDFVLVETLLKRPPSSAGTGCRLVFSSKDFVNLDFTDVRFFYDRDREAYLQQQAYLSYQTSSSDTRGKDGPDFSFAGGTHMRVKVRNSGKAPSEIRLLRRFSNEDAPKDKGLVSSITIPGDGQTYTVTLKIPKHKISEFNGQCSIFRLQANIPGTFETDKSTDILSYTIYGEPCYDQIETFTDVQQFNPDTTLISGITGLWEYLPRKGETPADAVSLSGYEWNRSLLCNTLKMTSVTQKESQGGRLRLPRMTTMPQAILLYVRRADPDKTVELQLIDETDNDRRIAQVFCQAYPPFSKHSEEFLLLNVPNGLDATHAYSLRFSTSRTTETSVNVSAVRFYFSDPERPSPFVPHEGKQVFSDTKVYSVQGKMSFPLRNPGTLPYPEALIPKGLGPETFVSCTVRNLQKEEDCEVRLRLNTDNRSQSTVFTKIPANTARKIILKIPPSSVISEYPTDTAPGHPILTVEGRSLEVSDIALYCPLQSVHPTGATPEAWEAGPETFNHMTPETKALWPNLAECLQDGVGADGSAAPVLSKPNDRLILPTPDDTVLGIRFTYSIVRKLSQIRGSNREAGYITLWSFEKDVEEPQCHYSVPVRNLPENATRELIIPFPPGMQTDNGCWLGFDDEAHQESSNMEPGCIAIDNIEFCTLPTSYPQHRVHYERIFRETFDWLPGTDYRPDETYYPGGGHGPDGPGGPGGPGAPGAEPLRFQYVLKLQNEYKWEFGPERLDAFYNVVLSCAVRYGRDKYSWHHPNATSCAYDKLIMACNGYVILPPMTLNDTAPNEGFVRLTFRPVSIDSSVPPKLKLFTCDPMKDTGYILESECEIAAPAPNRSEDTASCQLSVTLPFRNRPEKIKLDLTAFSIAYIDNIEVFQRKPANATFSHSLLSADIPPETAPETAPQTQSEDTNEAVSQLFTCDTGGKYQDDDNDGIPNWWERRYTDTQSSHALDAAADSDGDGYTNHEEFILYSDPLNADSAFNLSFAEAEPSPARLASPPQMLLSWPAAEGRVYTVYASERADADWQQLEPFRTLQGCNGILSVSLPTDTPLRFFRVSAALASPTP